MQNCLSTIVLHHVNNVTSIAIKQERCTPATHRIKSALACHVSVVIISRPISNTFASALQFVNITSDHFGVYLTKGIFLCRRPHGLTIIYSYRLIYVSSRSISCYDDWCIWRAKIV